MVQWHIQSFSYRHATFYCKRLCWSVRLSIHPSVGPSWWLSWKFWKRTFLRLLLWLCVCKSVWGEWGCEWGPCPPIRNSFVTLCHLLFLDLSFNLSATIFLSDCLALSQIVCISLSLSFVSLFFCQSVCLMCRCDGNSLCQIFVCTWCCTPLCILFIYYLNYQNLSI